MSNPTDTSVPYLPESSLTNDLPPPSAGHAYLLMMSYGTSPTPSVSTRLATPLLVIGSDTSCGLRLADPSISPRHARVESRGDKWFIRDLQSARGLFVNETRVTEAALSDFDRIQIGNTVVLFRTGEETSHRLASKNLEWNRQLERLPAFATTDFPVLMIGPSGAGKEVLAKTIHQSSRRKSGPFVTINCSALSESLIESELFGHVRGSFTGATHDRKGAFEIARGGTIFLDEIGDLPLSLQPKLLRALENKEIRPVGSDRTIETDVRVLAATHKDLELMVQQGRFREDLYWRLNVCSIRPPALKNRMEDFTDLAYGFGRQMHVRLSHGAVEKMREHSWPGNVRELKNVIARASAYYPGHYIQPEDIASLIDRPLLPASMTYNGVDSGFVGEMMHAAAPAGGSVMREIEREMIIRRLVANRGNQRKTALELGMPKSTLHDRLKTYSIDLEQIKQFA